MSAATSPTIIAGSVWYSTTDTSGALPARVAVSSLAEESVPPPASVCLTWMSGWALFHASTIGSWAVPHAQYWSVTGPLLVESSSEPESPPEQPTSSAPTAIRAPAAVITLERMFHISLDVVLGSGCGAPSKRSASMTDGRHRVPGRMRLSTVLR